MLNAFPGHNCIVSCGDITQLACIMFMFLHIISHTSLHVTFDLCGIQPLRHTTGIKVYTHHISYRCPCLSPYIATPEVSFSKIYIIVVRGSSLVYLAQGQGSTIQLRVTEPRPNLSPLIN